MKLYHFFYKTFFLGFVFLFAEAATGAAEEKRKSSKKTIYHLDPITVTAKKRQDALHHTPLGLSVIRGEDIGITSADSLDKIALKIPNVTIYPTNGRRDTLPFIRGVGSIDFRTSPAIGFYVDDVSYLSTLLFNFPLYDIERIELLRGPQGTLYGRNALGGVINIRTSPPQAEPSGKLDLSFGNFDLQQYEVVANTPVLADHLFLRLSGIYANHDGYTKNDFTGNDNQERDEKSGRIQLRWLPLESLDMTLKVDAEDFDNGGLAVTPLEYVKFHHVSSNIDSSDESEAYGVSLRTHYEGQHVEVESITGWRKRDGQVHIDSDFTPQTIVIRTVEDKPRQFTQELRFRSPEAKDEKLHWIAGGYYFIDDNQSLVTNSFGADAVSLGILPFPMVIVGDDEFDNRGYAIFSEVSYALLEPFQIAAGLRFDREEKEVNSAVRQIIGGNVITGPRHREEESFTEWLPSISLNYKWSDDMMTYFTWEKGYRSGGFNAVSSRDFADSSYKREKTFNYEVGIKSSWFNDRLKLNLAAFYIDWKDQQILQFTPLQDPFIDNTGESRSKGIELEGRVLPVPGLEVFAAFGITDAEFEENSDPVADTDFSGNTLPFVPERSASIGMRYEMNLRSEVRGFAQFDFHYIGKVFWDQANTLEQNHVEILDLQLGLDHPRWTWTLWAKNVFDEEYFSLALEFPVVEAGGEFGAPVTYGTTLTWKF